MRILNITTQKPNSTGSGVYLTELVNQFHALGHQQAVIAGIDVDDTVRLDSNISFYPVHFNTEYLPFNVVGMSDNMPYPSTRYNQLSEDMAKKMESEFIKVVEKAISEFAPDIIICHHLYFLTSIIREHFPNKKILGICHGTDMRQLLKTDLQRDRIKNNIRKLDMIFALHDAQREEIHEIYDFPRNKINILGVGYNNNVFFNKDYKKDTDVINLIYAGKIGYKKGVYSLLKSLEMIKSDVNFRLYLAGGYSDESEYLDIVNLSKKMSFNIDFLGKLSQSELAEYFNRSHVMILPSFFEGLPLVLIEALACGLSVISTDLPGVKQWIDSNVPDNDIKYVPLPKMRNVDEPDRDDLTNFEYNLSQTIQSVIENYTVKEICLDDVLWENVCKKVLHAVIDSK